MNNPELNKGVFIDWLDFKVWNRPETFAYVHSLFDNLVETHHNTQKGLEYAEFRSRTVRIHRPKNTIELITVHISSKGLTELKISITQLLVWVLENCQYKEDEDGIPFPSGITRIDIAVDDFRGLIRVPALMKRIRDKKIQTKMKVCRFVDSLDLHGFENIGHTIYLGNRASSLFIRFYDKYSKCKNEKIPVPKDIKIWNRMEFELKDSLANVFVEKYLYDDSFSAYGFFLSKIKFTHSALSKTDKNRYRKPAAKWYVRFLRDTREKTRLKVPVMKYDLETLDNYVENKLVGPVDTYIKIRGISALHEAIDKKKDKIEGNKKYQKLIRENEGRKKGMNILEFVNKRAVND